VRDNLRQARLDYVQAKAEQYRIGLDVARECQKSVSKLKAAIHSTHEKKRITEALLARYGTQRLPILDALAGDVQEPPLPDAPPERQLWRQALLVANAFGDDVDMSYPW
jgi:hypothetical protein